MMAAFDQPFHGIQFGIPDEGYYETQDGLSWGVNPTNTHDWNQGASEIKLQISRRETRSLPTERRTPIQLSYFRFLPFVPTELTCLALAEIIAEKIRASYQRNKARDVYDLGMFATRPLDQVLIRRLVVLKLWRARDSFDPGRLINKFEEARDFDWDDLRDLLRRNVALEPERITADCVMGFGFLVDLSEDEQLLANDRYQREQGAAEKLRTLIALA